MDFTFRLVNAILIGLDGPLLLGAVPGQLLRQTPQVRPAAFRSLFFGPQCGQSGFFSGDLLRQGAGLGLQLRLAGEQLLRLCPEFLGQSLLFLDPLLRLGRTADIVLQPSIQALPFPCEVLLIFP